MLIAKPNLALPLLLIIALLVLTGCGETTATLPPFAQTSALTATPNVQVSTTPPFTNNPATTTSQNQTTLDATTAPVSTEPVYEPPPIGTVYNTIWRTENEGESWSKVYTAASTETSRVFEPFLGLHCTSTSLCFNGYSMITFPKDGTPSPKGFGTSQSAFDCLDELNCWLLDYHNGTISRTTDGGKTFVNKTQGKELVVDKANQDIYSKVRRSEGVESEVPFVATIKCYGQNFCLTSGTGGRFIRTRDGGQSWEWFFGPTQATALFDCFNQNDCLAKSSNQTSQTDQLVVTNNGGQSWQIRSLPGIAEDLSCPNIKTCFAVIKKTEEEDIIVATHDSGTKWVNILQEPQKYFTTVDCFDTNTCYTADTTGRLLKTTDGGKNWTNQAQFTLKQSQFVSTISCATQQVCYLNVAGWH